MERGPPRGLSRPTEATRARRPFGRQEPLARGVDRAQPRHAARLAAVVVGRRQRRRVRGPSPRVSGRGCGRARAPRQYRRAPRDAGIDVRVRRAVTAPLDGLRAPLTRWLAERLDDVEVSELERPPVGQSNDTLLFTATWTNGSDRRRERLVLRRQQTANAIFREPDVLREGRVLRGLAEAA